MVWFSLKVKLQGNLMLPHVLYGCETWAFILWKEYYKLTLFHNTAIKRTFGPSRGTDMKVQETAE
jgi:hypothetical protein